MTDKEIIKTLTKAVFIGDSPIGKAFGTIIDKQTVKETIDFINRQKAEIERLETVLSEKLFCITQLKGENFALTNERDAYKNLLKNAKTEAVKEFAERLNAKAQNATTWTGIEPVVTISDIKDTAKALVGGNNATD